MPDTEWEEVNANGTPPGKPDEWSREPCLSIIKGGFSVNQVAMKRFGMAIGGRLKLLINRQRLMIGFKVIPEGQSEPGAYAIRSPNAKDRMSCIVLSKPVSALSEQFSGNTYLIEESDGIGTVNLNESLNVEG